MKRGVADIIVGADEVVFGVLSALICGGHALLEGPPGTGKTLLAKTIAQLGGLDFRRVQFTPDLLPADIVGGVALKRGIDGIEETIFRPGPVFTNVLLADELNRASPRTQAALLEAMEERQVTAGAKTHVLADPFVVLATQNPVDHGIYPVPASQLDRFLVRVQTQAASADELVEILATDPRRRLADVTEVVSGAELLHMRAIAGQVVTATEVLRYIADVVRATDPHGDTAPKIVSQCVTSPVSARGARALLDVARVRAVSLGRSHLSEEDVASVADIVLSHRLVLSFAGDSQGPSRSEIVAAAVSATRSSSRWRS